jgi:hypothetical protein
MATRDEYLAQPLSERLARLARTPDEIAAPINGRNDGDLGRGGAGDGWSAKELVCHLRDIEELCILRFHTMLVMDDPLVFVAGAPPPDPERWGIAGAVPFPLDPERWNSDRQYLRNDAREALAAFRRRRSEVLAFFAALTPAQWRRGSMHPVHGRINFEAWTAAMAAHDDNHVDQLRRALRDG